MAHFFTLNVALNILISDSLSADSEYRTFANELLLHFVSKSAAIYGNFLVYSFHSLVHLDNSSAFVFENFMQTLKRLARSGRNPVLQVSHRLHEYNLYSKNSSYTCRNSEFKLHATN